jgi:hypothetical protein
MSTHRVVYGAKRNLMRYAIHPAHRFLPAVERHGGNKCVSIYLLRLKDYVIASGMWVDCAAKQPRRHAERRGYFVTLAHIASAVPRNNRFNIEWP